MTTHRSLKPVTARLRLVSGEPAATNLSLALAEYRHAQAALVTAVRRCLPRLSSLSLQLPGGDVGECESCGQRPGAQMVTVMGVACAEDVLDRVHIQLFDERRGRMLELPLIEVLRQIGDVVEGDQGPPRAA